MQQIFIQLRTTTEFWSLLITMADPTGFLGTGIGVISLGLQIYGELKTYLDTYRNRDDQVDKALNRLEVLHQSLDIIKNALPDFESEQRVTCDTVRLHLQSCKDKMLSLQAELQKHEPSPCTNLKGKMKEAKKKVQFPFSQNTLAELDGHLERILQTLSFAIKGLGL
jgi:hypothetical protein